MEASFQNYAACTKPAQASTKIKKAKLSQSEGPLTLFFSPVFVL